MAYYCASSQRTCAQGKIIIPKPPSELRETKHSMHEEQRGTTPALPHFCLAALPSAGLSIFTVVMSYSYPENLQIVFLF